MRRDKVETLEVAAWVCLSLALFVGGCGTSDTRGDAWRIDGDRRTTTDVVEDDDRIDYPWEHDFERVEFHSVEESRATEDEWSQYLTVHGDRRHPWPISDETVDLNIPRYRWEYFKAKADFQERYGEEAFWRPTHMALGRPVSSDVLHIFECPETYAYWIVDAMFVMCANTTIRVYVIREEDTDEYSQQRPGLPPKAMPERWTNWWHAVAAASIAYDESRRREATLLHLTFFVYVPEFEDGFQYDVAPYWYRLRQEDSHPTTHLDYYIPLDECTDYAKDRRECVPQNR